MGKRSLPLNDPLPSPIEGSTATFFYGGTLMKLHSLALNTLILALVLDTPGVFAQTQDFENAAMNAVPARVDVTFDSTDSSSSFVIVPPHSHESSRSYRPFSEMGLATRVGFDGTGFDVATPLTVRFNVRAGADFFSYATSFQEEGANVGINLHLGSGHAALDWFPFGGHLRLSPQIVFGNNNRILATAIIPSGSTVTLNGQDYVSSATNPLHGSGRIDFRKVSPGISFGFGNLIPRDRSRFSIPVEMGFYYAGQPSLQVAFSGSACDPNYPASVGCESVDQDTGFQQNLAAFKARNDHNLSYASFFPIFSVGFGYRLW
jgi:hypothetical protein